MPIEYLRTTATSNACIAGNGSIPKRSDTSEYIKEWFKGSVYLYDNWYFWLKKSTNEVDFYSNYYYLFYQTLFDKFNLLTVLMVLYSLTTWNKFLINILNELHSGFE